MSVFSYRTLQSPAEAIYKEKGSKFMAFACPVESELVISTHLEVLKKKYFDARHHCYAYCLGYQKEKFRAFDDGEPNHSAGDPILGKIRSKNLTNVLVVVVRYFGGVKLGVGGLINAYKTATESALANAAIIEKEILKEFTITYRYSSTPEIMRLVREFELHIDKQRFENDCLLAGAYKVKYAGKLGEKLNLLKATGHYIEFEM